MTLKEARRLFRSLRYYDRLSQSIRAKESRLAYLIEEHEITRIDGYQLELREDVIYYKKLPHEGYRQLKLPFDIKYQ